MGKAAIGAATFITAKSRFPSSRRGPTISRVEDAAHAKALGEVLHAWNRAHAALFMVFARIATDNDHEFALALWHTAQGDKVQRDMLQAAANARLQKRKSHLNAITWAINAMNEIGSYRNDITHSEMTFYYTRLVPGLTAKKQSLKRLEQRRLDKNWLAVRGDLHALANYLEHIQFGLWMKMPRPLSQRPKLRFVRSTSLASQERRRRAKKAAQQRQRESRPN